MKQEQVYPFTFIYRGKKTTLLWVSGELGDYFKMTDDRVLYQSKCIQDAKCEFDSLPFQIEWSESETIDFDMFWKEINALNVGNATDESACKVLLSGWNFIEDMMRTFSLNYSYKELDKTLIDKTYKKIFYGNNIQAVTPENSGYMPLWGNEELINLRLTLLKVWEEIGYITKLWNT